MSIPTDCKGAIVYFALLPIVFPLWLTLPDTRKNSGEVVTNKLINYHFQGGGDEEEENQPLDLSWPDTCRERITYIAFLPIIIPLWLTLPDTRKESGQTSNYTCLIQLHTRVLVTIMTCHDTRHSHRTA